MRIFKKTIKIILLIGVIIFAISIFQKDKLPEKNDIVSLLYQEPIQAKTDAGPFNAKRGGVEYTISPLYEYELFGLVASYHHSSDWFDYYHKKWNDFINEKDICVIWGENLKSDVYKKIKYKNGSWTCYWQTKQGVTREEWLKFNNDQISNNHLLTSNERISQALAKIEKGDQIYIKGYLARYTQDESSFERGTSISRTDTGTGSCETIYVTQVQILKKSNLYWRTAHTFSKYIIFSSIILLIIVFFATTKARQP